MAQLQARRSDRDMAKTVRGLQAEAAVSLRGMGDSRHLRL